MPPKEEKPLTTGQKFKLFFAVHWRGVLSIVIPIVSAIVLLVPYPPMGEQWCAYTLVVMAIFWVTEAIPLAVTSFLPMLIFPLCGLSTTAEVAKSYFNDTTLMFLGSLILAYSVEQSGLHRRLALNIIRIVGYTHVRLLFAMTMTTWFVSFWITNTAATTMMVPINFAVLEVFEKKNIMKIFDTDITGEQFATPITVCYFCAATFSATIGGIGTLVGTGTNLAFKGLFITNYPNAPDYLSFPLFSAFSVPYCLVLQLLLYASMVLMFLGKFRPNSKAAKRAVVTPELTQEVKKAIRVEIKKIGRMTYWELNVAIIFSSGMAGFFLRSPQIMTGWGDKIADDYNLADKKFIRDSAWAYLVALIFLVLPAKLEVIKKLFVKSKDSVTRYPQRSLLDWNITERNMPFSFTFLLGGGFAFADGAKKGLTDQIGTFLSGMRTFPNSIVQLCLIVFTIFLTNFASNVAVANVVCPIAMSLAEKIGQNPLRFNMICGVSASYCFMLPVGTPGNLIVQSAAKIGTMDMIKAGALPTLLTIIVTWLAFMFWAPVIFPVYYEANSPWITNT